MPALPTGASPAHHPPAELLLEHAGGCGTEAEALVIARHLDLCPDCRAEIRDCAAIGGAMLDSIEPVQLPPNMLNRTLEAIDSPSRMPEAAPAGCGRSALDLEVGAWRKLPGGVRVRRLPVAGPSERLVLMRVPPGGAILPHRHAGDEWTLVLQGGFSDRTGHFGRGDFAVMSAEDKHKPIADPGEECVCLLLIRGEPRYSGLLGRLMGPFVKL